jgi:hypothetical protein
MAFEKSRRWTASCVLDLERAAFECPTLEAMHMAFAFLEACTIQVRSNERPNDYKGLILDLPEIKFVRVKNRFRSPTKGGWADILINFVFTADKNRHVHEIQIQHCRLLNIRRTWKEGTFYANLRVLADFLDTAPHASVEEPNQAEESKEHVTETASGDLAACVVREPTCI